MSDLSRTRARMQLDIPPGVTAGTAFDFERVGLSPAGLVLDLCVHVVPPAREHGELVEHARVAARIRLTAQQADGLAVVLQRGAEAWEAWTA